jgi:hypothetical protein
MPNNVLDLELDAAMVFCQDEWIGQGKKYTDVPPYVSRALIEAQRLPETARSKFPHMDMSVMEFLDVKLSTVSTELVTTDIGEWFGNFSPQSNVTALFTRAIPPQHLVLKLEEEIGQAWFDGAESIVDRRFSSKGESSPLWTLTYWREMSRIVRVQRDWREALNWLAVQSQHTMGLPSPAVLLRSVGWNSKISSRLKCHASTSLGMLVLHCFGPCASMTMDL